MTNSRNLIWPFIIKFLTSLCQVFQLSRCQLIFDFIILTNFIENLLKLLSSITIQFVLQKSFIFLFCQHSLLSKFFFPVFIIFFCPPVFLFPLSSFVEVSKFFRKTKILFSVLVAHLLDVIPFESISSTSCSSSLSLHFIIN